MFPSVVEPIEKFINTQKERGSEATKKGPRLKWQPQYKMLSVEPPVPLEEGKYKKAYKIRFRYRDTEAGLNYVKTVLFGTRNEFVNNGDNKLRTIKHTRLSHQQDPFHPNYWTLQILNTLPTAEEGYTHLIGKLVSMKK